MAETMEELQRRITGTEDLQSVVRTMKAMAAVNIQQYEAAARSVEVYHQTVERALSAAVRQAGGAGAVIEKAPRRHLGAIVFGSDQGMCGQLNEAVFNHAMDAITWAKDSDRTVTVSAVGERVSYRLADQGHEPTRTFAVPDSVEGITGSVYDVLFLIESWEQEEQVDHVQLFYTHHESAVRMRPVTRDLLPVDRLWLETLSAAPWPTKNIPMVAEKDGRLFSRLVRQYLFVGLFSAFAESLASENASRLRAMQSAEKNIEERLDDLTGRFHQVRQMSITSELLDVVSGYEALQGG